ncbi:cullin-3-like [Dermacentor albipictus]|uniref:cullin-3-like n=1 Tax=Dermacentor albipictus TaxID=60249 RepID=UPI0038FC6953
MDTFEYIAKVEQHIKEESEWARQCLCESTVASVVQVVEKELIGKHIKAILEMGGSGLVHMLKHRMTQSLARTYRLLKCVQGGPKTMLECMSKYLRDAGRSIVRENGDSVNLVPKVMELKESFDHFLQLSFGDDQLVKQMITTDFEYILSLTRKSPELLSVFEKDLFDRYYKQHLAKRLLLNKCVSIDAERSMVAKLANECGGMFTSQMEAMFKDLNINNMMLDFKVKIQPTSHQKNSAPKIDGNAGNVGNVEEGRRYELEAAIVRIMKARKTLSHDDLLVEVTNVLKARYTPSPAAFKKRVDALIEREYLERATENPEVYIYMP